MIIPTLTGKNYARAKWPKPNVTDNSGEECSIWTKPHIDFPWKVRIGIHFIKYFAQDKSGNKAKCSFTVKVVGK